MNNNELLIDILLDQALWHLTRHGFLKDNNRVEININNDSKESAFYHGQFNMLARIVVHFNEEQAINIFEHSSLSKEQAKNIITMLTDYIDDHRPRAH